MVVFVMPSVLLPYGNNSQCSDCVLDLVVMEQEEMTLCQAKTCLHIG